MAPARKTGGSRTRKAPPVLTLQNYSKVSKPQSTTRSKAKKEIKITIDKLEDLAAPESPNAPGTQNPKDAVIPAADKKRKRDNIIDDSEIEAELQNQIVPVGKKVKIFIPTPPRSQKSSRSSSPEQADSHNAPELSPTPTTVSMPQTLKELNEIHRCFIKAFSFNRTYYGATAPAEINELLQTATKLYKKRLLVREDIQRVLAVYEIPKKVDVPKMMLDAEASPFKLIASGVGFDRREFVDYVENQITSGLSWNEEQFLVNYEADIQKVFIFNRRAADSFIFGPVSDYPLLAFKLGSQTAARHEKATALRTYITEKTQPRPVPPELSSLSINDPHTPLRPASKVKARMSSLFERIKSKESANNAKPAPSSEEALRRHAIARIDEIIEVLKMKQQAKMKVLPVQAHQTSGSPLRRVSFTMTELVKMVKNSILSQMGEAEIKMAITILSKEAPGFWLRTLNMDGVICVVLQGNGPVGLEVQKVLQQKDGIVNKDVSNCDFSMNDVNSL